MYSNISFSNRGTYYYEATVTDEGLCRLGFSTPEAALDLGTCKYGYGYGGTGKKSNNRQFDDYGGPFGKNFKTYLNHYSNLHVSLPMYLSVCLYFILQHFIAFGSSLFQNTFRFFVRFGSS